MELQAVNKKPLHRKWWFWLGLVVLILVVIYGVASTKKNQGINQGDESKEETGGNFNWPSTTAKYITTVPVDLTQIENISKYRSCSGHIRDGYNFEKILENDRTMKHYLLPIAEFQNTNNKVKIFAPFDGMVRQIDPEKDIEVGAETINGAFGIHLSTPVDPNVDFIFGHVYFIKDFKAGDKVTVGELLGYAATACGKEGGATGCNFDIDLSTPSGTSAYNGREVLGSIFDHMTDSVLAEFAKYGITPENIKFTKEYRDTHPCDYENPEENQSKIGTASDIVELTH